MSRRTGPDDDRGNLRHCVHYAGWGDDGPEMTCVDCWVTGKLRARHESAEGLRQDGVQRRTPSPTYSTA